MSTSSTARSSAGEYTRNFLNKGANFAMRQDLRRLEAMMEAGEIPTIEGQSHGPRDFMTGVDEICRPDASKSGTIKPKRHVRSAKEDGMKAVC